MSCAYRTHRYRASVTAHPTSVSWNHVTGHARHPIPLRPPVVRPGRQVVMATTDDAPIPVSLIRYLWSQWQESPPDVRDAVSAVIGELMQSPRWHWDVTVLPDRSPPDPQDPFVSERDGRPTIGMPIAMLRELWRWVLDHINKRASILRWWVPTIDPSLWQELLAIQKRRGPTFPDCLYGYLSPLLFPDIAEETHRLFRATSPDDQYRALTVLTRWLESPDHETRTVAAQMLHGWPYVVAAIVRFLHPFNDAIRTMLDRLVPTILTATRSEDRVAWVTTLWTLGSDSTISDERRQAIATALHQMMHDPMVVSVVWNLLRTGLSAQRIMAEPVWDPLLATLIRTVCADEVLMMIEQALATVRATMGTDHDPIVRRFDRILAAGWGHGQDHRILQMVTAHPSPHWQMVLTEGIATSVGAEVCARLLSWFPPDQAMALIVNLIHAREKRGDWPLAPLPAHLIPWVSAAARTCPNRLHPTTIRRLWLADPDRAWNVTQTMLHSDDPYVQVRALEAMDTGWGTGMDDTIATILRTIILTHRHLELTGTTTAVAGIGIAPPSIMESLLTELATRGNTNVQQWLIRNMHRRWGRGQDALMMRTLEILDERGASEQIWADAHETLRRAWDYLPPYVVVSLIDRLVTRATNRLAKDGSYSPLGLWEIPQIIAAFAPIWTHLPTPLVIERIAHHVAHLHAHAHTITPRRRNTLVSAWAQVIATGAARLSASDIHALLDPLWTLSLHGCLNGIERWVRR